MNDKQIYKIKRQDVIYKKYQRTMDMLATCAAVGGTCTFCSFLIFVVLAIFGKLAIIPIIVVVAISVICVIIAMYLDIKSYEKLKTELSKINE